MRAASSFLAVVSTLACGTQFPEPNITSHATDDYVEVPYFPPAALAEVAGAPPIDACVWFGGHWVWRGDKYVWKRGGWVQSRPGLFYAPSKTIVLGDGRIMFAAGTWYDEAGHEVPPPAIVKPASTPSNEVTSEFETPR